MVLILLKVCSLDVNCVVRETKMYSIVIERKGISSFLAHIGAYAIEVFVLN